MADPEKLNVVPIGDEGQKMLATIQDNKDGKLTLQVAAWLSKRGIASVVSTTDDGVFLLDYVVDGVIQPTLRINNGSVIWPKGTNYDLMMEFLSGK